jgi:hypothetical protein
MNNHQILYCMFNVFSDAMSFSMSEGTSNTFRLSGNVWNTDAEAFLQKAVIASFSSSTSDAEWLARIKDNFNRTDVCGVLAITAGVIPEVIEAVPDIDAEGLEAEPIEITIGLAMEQWLALRLLCQSAIDTGRYVSGSFNFWPPPGTRYGLHRLDIREASNYPVYAFNLARSRERTSQKEADDC